MTAKITANSAGDQLTLSVGVEDALLIDAAAKTIEAAAPYEIVVPQGPAFIAAAIGGQTFTSGVIAKFNNGTEVVDTDNCYDNSLSRFTPNVAGLYQVNVGFGCTGTTTTDIGLYVRKNAATPAELQFYIRPMNTATGGTVALSGLVYLNGTTDYIEPFALISGTGTLTASAMQNSFSASLVRAM